MSRTERRKAATRVNLLAAARQQISTSGLSSLSIQATTELADVALGTFYNHFANKDELIDELLDQDLQRMRRTVLELQAHAGDAVERVAAGVAAAVGRAASEPGWARFAAEFWSIGRWPVDSPDCALLMLDLRTGAAHHQFGVVDELLSVVSGYDLIGGILRHYADLGEEIDDRTILRHAVTAVLRLLGTPELDIDRAVTWAECHPLPAAAFEQAD